MLTIFNNLQPFFEDNYKRVHVREYAKLQKISPPHASKVLKSFKKEGLLRSEEDRRYLFFSANRENSLFKKLQQTYYVIRLKELIEHLEKELTTPVIVLFGSATKAEITPHSDLDIAVFTPSKKKINIKKFEKKLKRPIQLFIFKNKEELRNNKEFLNNISNGVILLGRW